MLTRTAVIALVVLLLGSVDAAAQSTPRRFTLDAIRDRCITLTAVKVGSGPDDARECRVSEFGEAGVVDGETYHYALYCLIPGWSKETGTCADTSFNARYHRARALVVFTSTPSRPDAQLVFEHVSSEISMNVYARAAIVTTNAGTLLHLSIAVDGTGHYNASEYYVRERGRWERIEAESWQNDLGKRLPAGLQIWKGIWPDPRTLRADAGLYRDGDGNCCPTGGVAHIQLALRDRRFVLEAVTFDSRQP
jgi:hypothetical protein